MNSLVLDQILEAIKSDDKYKNIKITFSNNKVIYLAYETFVIIIILKNDGTAINKINARKLVEKFVTDRIFNRDFNHDPHHLSHRHHYEYHDHYHRACYYYHLRKPNPPYSLLRAEIKDYKEYLTENLNQVNVLESFIKKLKEISDGK